MSADNKNKTNLDSKAGFAVLATVVSTFVVLLGLVWNQATWQSAVSANVSLLKTSQSLVITKLDESELLIRENAAKIEDIENALNKNISREDMIFWIFSLKQMNPDISVPIPEKH